MATEARIDLSGLGLALFDQKSLDESSAKEASEVLQENHDVHHIFYEPRVPHVS